MGIGTSIFLFAVGAILRFAVSVQTDGLDVHMVGVILMCVGAVGALISLMFWSTWGGFGNASSSTYRRDVVAPGEHTVVVEKQSRI